MKEKTPLIILAFLVTFGAIANLVRLIWNIPLCIGTFVLPGWTGAIFFIVLGLLAAWSFRALCSETREPPANRERKEEPPPPFA